MSWDDDANAMADDLSAIFAFDGTVQYQDATTGPLSLSNVPVTSQRQQRRRTRYGIEYVTVRKAYVMNDNPDLTTPLREDGTMIIDNIRYAIEELNPMRGGRTEVMLRKVKASEISREKFRG